MEQARKFLETLRDDPGAREILTKGSKGKPDTNEEIIAAYAEAAEKLGFDLTAEQIAEGIREQVKEMTAVTARAENAVRELDPEELDKVAGGRDKDCADTFNNYENCWYNDACDRLTNSYWNYKCKTSAVGSTYENCADLLF